MQDATPAILAALSAAQNPDGGWGYQDGGSSWTEPAALALLALRGHPPADAVEKGVAYLLSSQRADGGWAPRRSVDQSTWVTALALLALGSRLPRESLARAVEWIGRQRGEDSGFFYKLRHRMLGIPAAGAAGEGWPWFPETAAWVTPTALTIIALDQSARHGAQGVAVARVRPAREFLWSRTCQDGGWNHGSTRALGYEANSYPETTGVALAALAGSASPKLAAALGAAERHIATCRSSSARSWLRIGLAAHRRAPRSLPPEPPLRGCMDRALFVLAERASAGRSPFGD